jgi:hypothetical protein
MEITAEYSLVPWTAGKPLTDSRPEARRQLSAAEYRSANRPLYAPTLSADGKTAGAAAYSHVVYSLRRTIQEPGTATTGRVVDIFV